jgi:hypothetical protein
VECQGSANNFHEGGFERSNLIRIHLTLQAERFYHRRIFMKKFVLAALLVFATAPAFAAGQMTEVAIEPSGERAASPEANLNWPGRGPRWPGRGPGGYYVTCYSRDSFGNTYYGSGYDRQSVAYQVQRACEYRSRTYCQFMGCR